MYSFKIHCSSHHKESLNEKPFHKRPGAATNVNFYIVKNQVKRIISKTQLNQQMISK